ncbi:ferredoxin--NADP reductase [Chitinophagaceae bacterium LWZ2-11]
MLEPWRTGKVIEIKDLTSATRLFRIQIPEVDDFNFKPGQFVTLDLPIHEQKNKRWRSYSIASAPDGTNIIELVIVLLEGGAGTTYLFNEITIGSEILLRGPQGVFTLHEPLDKEIFLICTGTGVAPFRSMIRFIKHHNLSHQNIHLIFGCRKFEDCLYVDEMRNLEKHVENFHYHPVFSRENEVGEGMYKGYVHGVYENILKEEKKEAQFYLCGWKNMVDEAKQRILNLGYDKKDIHLELYG